MNWMSLDIADGVSGAVVWEDNVPITVARLVLRHKKATKTLPERRHYTVFFRNLESCAAVQVEYENEAEAWRAVRNGLELSHLVLEAGFMRFPSAAMSLAEARGRCLAILGAYGPRAPVVLRTHPSSWRKGVKAMCGAVIPGRRDAAKKAAIELVRQIAGWVLTDDEAEAYLLGRWAWWAGKVE
jgi:hypothetical protein